MRQTDQVRAERMLRVRSEGGDFGWRQLFGSPRLWAVAVINVGLCVGGLVAHLHPLLTHGAFLLCGIFIGRIIRDWIWLRDICDAASFREQVTNWDKVQELAEGSK